MARRAVRSTTLVPQKPQFVQAGTSLDELRREWRSLYKSEPPKISRDLLILGIAYRRQEIEHGGLGKATSSQAADACEDLTHHRSGRPLAEPQSETGRPPPARMAWSNPYCDGYRGRLRILRRELRLPDKELRGR